MSRIFVPARSALDWQPLLSRPDRHWKAGYSAMSLACCWQEASDDLPPEIRGLLLTGQHPALEAPQLLFAMPEFQVDLPGGVRPTQTDVFALVRGRGGLAALAVEGEVEEAFGPTVETKRSEGASDRLTFLHDLLGLDPEQSGKLRYQLLHRSAAAILLAQKFFAPVAVMVVHSFSQEHRWYDDFERFVDALGRTPARGALIDVGTRGGVELLLGWVTGEQRFREGCA